MGTADGRLPARAAQHRGPPGGLADGLTIDRAVDILWFCFGTSAWRTLVKEYGWTWDEAERWLAVKAAILIKRACGPPRSRSNRRRPWTGCPASGTAQASGDPPTTPYVAHYSAYSAERRGGDHILHGAKKSPSYRPNHSGTAHSRGGRGGSDVEEQITRSVASAVRSSA
ncbi:hypothetical protein GCM10023194_57800 [Planotetraspora phitsanulokensis]|uniref:Uncharacterized protein n=1 Tax=Planotetraspora phitsanulokensis TaxID=575192 RepID=A0A8J3UDV4_9ACTN|nr:hypothetical protein Pph01_79730 [Planotetraspora phitsanulokensis]